MFIPGNNNVQGVNNMFLHMGLDPNSMPVFKGLLQREQQFQQQQQKQKQIQQKQQQQILGEGGEPWVAWIALGTSLYCLGIVMIYDISQL